MLERTRVLLREKKGRDKKSTGTSCSVFFSLFNSELLKTEGLD
jgi:hypothetical protein